MISESARVLYRVIPEQFRSSDYVVRGNLIFHKGTDGNLLRGAVGQLEDATELDVSGTNATRLFGGEAAFSQLSKVGDVAAVVGAVASVINLGVCVAGFMHVSRSLKQVERRLENIDRSLENIGEMLGVIDQKINQLLYMNELQLHALSDIGNLIKSYKTAEVHGALETLQFRLRRTEIPESDYDIREAIRTLQEYRIWLSDRRRNSDIPLPVRIEILRAEVHVTLAESRARCFMKDEAYAVSCLEQSLEGIRDEIHKAWNCVIEAHGPHALFSNDDGGDEDWLDVLVWLQGVNLKDAAYTLLKQMAKRNVIYESEEKTKTVQLVENKFSEGESLLRSLGLGHAADMLREEWIKTSSGEMLTIQLESKKATAVGEIFDEFTRQHWESQVDEGMQEMREAAQENGDPFGLIDWTTKILSAFDEQHEEDNNNEADDLEKRNRAADVASLSLCYRLARNVESALAVCATMEVVGDPVRQLLWAKEQPESPAIVLEIREPVKAD